MSGFKTNTLTGLAVLLSASGSGLQATYNAAGMYTAMQTGIVIGNVPQSPDRLIVLTAYDVSDSVHLSDSVLGVQVRTRWEGEDKRPVDDLDDAIFNLLHGKKGFTLSTGVKVVVCTCQNSTTLGQDKNGRWENVANYYLSVHRPSTYRT